MGILEYLLAGLGKETKKELAKDAAEAAVKGVGDRVYREADQIRARMEEAAEERRRAKEREEAERRAREQKAKDAKAIDDELAALKRKLKDPG